MALHVDSVDKIIETYFALVTIRAFTFKGSTYRLRQLQVSPGLFNEFQCPAGCGGCCKKFSLDYLPEPIETHPYRLKARTIEFDGHTVTVYSDQQRSNTGDMCRNLDHANGRCTIHGVHPFSCDFEVIKFFTSNSPTRLPRLTQQAYPRGWSYDRTDGTKGGAKCLRLGKTEPANQSNPSHTVNEVVRRLKRLKDWTDHFGIETKLPAVIAWTQQGPHPKAATF